MEQQELTTALLFILQQSNSGKLTAEQHSRLKTRLLQGDEAVKSAIRSAATGSVTLESLLGALRLDDDGTVASDSEPAILRAPLTILARAFAEAAHGRKPEDLCEDWGAAQCLAASLEEIGGWEAVPLLSSLRDDQIQSGRLVRYRGMVQDMFDPEFYVAVYERSLPSGGRELRSGMYSDTLIGEGISPATQKFGERALLYCVPVPGETSWVSAKSGPTQTQPTSMDTMSTTLGNAAAATAPATTAKQSSAPKRAMHSDDEDMPLVQEAIETERQKRGKSVANTETQRAPDPSLVQASFPLSSSQGPVCLAKIYESKVEYKLNNVVEFVGVLSVLPELVSFDPEADEFLDPSSALPPSLVPRVHVVMSRLVTAPAIINRRPSTTTADLRRRTVELLASHLRGDLLAAEYLLLNLLSKVHTRQASMPLGKLVLNISGVQPVLVRPLEALLQELLPRCCYFPVTLDNVHSCRVSPRKDHKSNKLLSGVLQLAEGTQMVVDESQLTSANFSQQGKQNLTMLKHALENQRVQYDFGFHTLEFDANFPVLVLSRTKAVLPVDCLIPLRGTQDTSPILAVLSAEEWSDLRAFLLAGRSQTDFAIDPEVTKALEEQFVKRRQQKPETGPELLHFWLTLGRLLATSFGETILSTALWERMQELETERLDRCQ